MLAGEKCGSQGKFGSEDDGLKIKWQKKGEGACMTRSLARASITRGRRISYFRHGAGGFEDRGAAG